ncbi:MAG: thiamine diphosphokinase [Bacteroidia bacterium]
MSSHHFVVEGQEPALVIANGEECSMQLLKQLIEWCPFIVVLDGAYERVMNLEIKMDMVIGDFDSIKTTERRPDVQYIKIEEQETTDLEKAIDWLSKAGYTDINIVWATGRRLDHTMNNLSLLGRYPNLHLVFYDNHSKAHLLPDSFSKHYEENSILSLLPLGRVEGISTQGLQYALDNETLELAKRSGSSNKVVATGLVQISHKKGHLVLIESRDESA